MLFEKFGMDKISSEATVCGTFEHGYNKKADRRTPGLGEDSRAA